MRSSIVFLSETEAGFSCNKRHAHYLRSSWRHSLTYKHSVRLQDIKISRHQLSVVYERTAACVSAYEEFRQFQQCQAVFSLRILNHAAQA